MMVLDNSVVMLWLLPQSNPSGVELATHVLQNLEISGAIVPSLWSLEAANVIAKSQRLGKITQAQASSFVALLDELNIDIDHATARHALHDTLDLARQYRLSAYDASYLELALRLAAPLATLDAALVNAAQSAGVKIVTVS
jgi:predicted nucleic acid-binding protein